MTKDSHLLSTGFAINTTLTVAEFVGATLTSSVALLADGLSNLTDSLVLIVAYFAERVSHRHANRRKTWGYGRVKVLASMLNLFIIFAISLFIGYSSVQKLFHPTALMSPALVAGMGLASLAVNAYVATTLFKRRHDVNIRPTFIKILFSVVGALSVLVSGLLNVMYNWWWADGVAGVVTACILVSVVYRLVLEVVNVLLEGVPPQFDAASVRASLLDIDQVKNIRGYHAWVITQDEYSFACKLIISQLDAEHINEVIDEAKRRLAHQHNFAHCIIEIELE